MATEGIAPKQNNVCDKDQGTHTYPKVSMSIAAWKPHCLDRVVCEDDQKNQCKVKEIAMNVLQYQGKFSFSAIVMTRFADSTRGRIGPKRFVIGAAIVIARESKSARS